MQVPDHFTNQVKTDLALQFGWLDEKNHISMIGHTRVNQPLELPRDKRLVVLPRQAMTTTDWDQLFDLMRAFRIHGLNASGRLTDDALQKLSSLDFLKWLILDGSRQVTDEGLLHLVRMPELEVLDIGCWECGITDKGLQVLGQLPHLKEFKMCWQQGITDAGISHLRYCRKLEKVNLMGTSTGDGALKALANLPSLTHLRTGRNVTDAGLKALHDFPVFKSWQGGEPDIGMLGDDAGPNHLMIDGPFTDAGLASLAGLDGLFGFSVFWHSKSFTSSGFKTISTLPNIGFIGLQDEHCDDDAMEYMGQMPNLKMLLGQGAIAGNRGFEGLAKSMSLENIWGRDFAHLYNDGFRALSRIPTLRGLAVSCRQVDGALAVLPDFPALRELTPIDVKDEGFIHVGKCTQLDALVCMYCRETTDFATEQIRELNNLKRYHAGMTQISDDSLSILGAMDSLESIELFKCEKITNEGISRLNNLSRLEKIEIGAMPQIDPARIHFSSPDVKVDYWN